MPLAAPVTATRRPWTVAGFEVLAISRYSSSTMTTSMRASVSVESPAAMWM
jgi:hypothetical protein